MINLEMIEMCMIKIVHAFVLTVVRKCSGLTSCVLSFFRFSPLSVFSFLVLFFIVVFLLQRLTYFFAYCSIVQLLEMPESHYSNVSFSHNEMLCHFTE